MAVVYQHRRKGTKNVFYIGVGVDTSRATNKSARSEHWKRLVKKNKGFEHDILLENISYEDALKWEIYLVALYGRQNKNTGNLVNLTDGGEGTPGKIVTEETRNKISRGNTGNKRKDLSFYNKTRIHPYLGKTSGKKGKTDIKAKERASVFVVCPHCGKEVQKLVGSRWHFDNCKSKEEPKR
jgi:hypothetical protein